MSNIPLVISDPFFGFTGNNPVSRVDYMGLAFYAVDGTWTAASDDSNPSQLITIVKEKPRRYYNGPEDGPSGIDGLAIARNLKAQICADFCQAKQRCEDFTINMTGWSRGAVIVAGVAKMLNDGGCDCGKKNYKPVAVNWIGLFDAVAMMGVQSWFPSTVPPNVAHFDHVVKTGKQAIFPTWHFAGANEVSMPRYDGSPTLHVDIGESKKLNNNGAYEWILGQAIAAGVAF